MTRRLHRLCIALALAAAGACSNASPTAPTPTPPATALLRGTWSGTLTTTHGDATLRMTLQSTLEGATERASGTYEVRLGDAITTGDVTGVYLLGAASVLLTPAGPARCPVDAASAGAGSLLFTASPSGNRLAGTGAWTQCAVTTQVPVVLTKP